MKKTDLARLQQQALELESIAESNIKSLVAVLESTFSAIATSDPDLALSIVAQLESQKDDITAVAVERASNAEMFIKKIANNMPDYLEFEEEDEAN